MTTYTIHALAKDFPPHRIVENVTHPAGDWHTRIAYPTYDAARASLPRGLRKLRPTLADDPTVVARFRGALTYYICREECR